MKTTNVTVTVEKANNLFKATAETTASCGAVAVTMYGATDDSAVAQALHALANKMVDPKTAIINDFKAACATGEDRWLPANGGTEKPFFSRSGRKLLYCYNPASGKHAYMDVGSDIVLTDEEANVAMGLI